MSKFKPQHRRLLFIDRKIKSKSYPNCTSLAAEWEVSPKTIQRDLDYIQDELDAPIKYDSVRHGYYYTEDNFSLPAINISDETLKHIEDECKRAYRAMDARSYLRFDIRLTPQGEVFFIEPNANPCIARIDEMAMAAQKAGISYEELIGQVVEQAIALNDQARSRKVKP